MQNILDGIVKDDPARFVTMVNTLPESEVYAEAKVKACRERFDHITVVDMIPHPARIDEAFSACAFIAAGRCEFSRAQELVESIEDPTKRPVAAAGVLNARVGRDPRGAWEWLPELTRQLPPHLAQFVTDKLNTKLQSRWPMLAIPE